MPPILGLWPFLLLPGVDVLSVDVLEAVASEVPMIVGGWIGGLLLGLVGLLRSLLAVSEDPGLRGARGLERERVCLDVVVAPDLRVLGAASAESFKRFG